MQQKNSALLFKFIFTALFISAVNSFAQDSTKSIAYKDNTAPNYSIKYNLMRPSYPLVAKFNLIQKANQDDPVSQHELGLRYLLGEGFETDTAKAIFWIRKAASKKFIPAKYNYGIMLMNGIGVEWDPFSAFNNFEYAAKQKFPEAQFILGLQYLDGLLVNKNYEEGIKWLKEAAEANYKPAVEALQELKESGYRSNSEKSSSSDSSSKSNIWNLDYVNVVTDNVVKEKDKVSADSFLTLDKKQLQRKFGITDSSVFDEKNNLELIETAANYGSPEALNILGKLYETGRLVELDKVKAASYYLQAYRLGNYKSATAVLEQVLEDNFFDILKPEVDKGNAEAEYVVAGLAAIGLNFQITQEQIINFLTKSAEQNYIPALLELGLIFYSGEIVSKDKNKAVAYWEKASKLGSREAEIRIASIKIFNKESQDLKEEVTLLKNYSEKGSVLAKTILAYCYKNGIGVKTDKAFAAKLFRDAAGRGNEAAWRSLQNMYDEIRPEEEKFKLVGE